MNIKVTTGGELTLEALLENIATTAAQEARIALLETETDDLQEDQENDVESGTVDW